jgi:hypothetical protein
MSHMYIPTTPPPRYSQAGKHRRSVRVDDTPTAQCSGCTITSKGILVKTFCPRHDANDYASHMGRHATDTIMPTVLIGSTLDVNL